jgi:hypothetical protein
MVTGPTGPGGGGSANIVEATTAAGFPATGSAGTLYHATNVRRIYFWDASSGVYVEAGPSGGGGGLAWSSVPSFATATGTAGQIAYDDANGFFYVATNANTWKRASLSTWFSPAQISGLAAWFDASDASTLYDSTTGGSLVANDGSVARWVDKSGSSNHALQATSGSRPARRSAGLGGLPSVQFVADSADNGDWLGIAHTSSLNGPSGLTIFMVASTSEQGSGRGLMGKWQAASGESGGNAWVFAYKPNSGTTAPTMLVNDGTAFRQAAGTTNFNDGSKRLLAMVSTSSSLAIRQNGVLQATQSPASVPAQSVTSGVVIGGFCGYSVASGQQLMSAHISEIIVYNATLSSGDIAAVESYLMTKWGLT